ncbi:MAG: hypothetical protein H7X95_06985, partial [Deltaproteobacteria bacterium]|nr:hypothetical protein [Deltaproteobacteria bacterium]
VAAAYFFVRTAVLGGMGRSADQSASFLGKLVQVGSGLAHVATGSVVIRQPLAWLIGFAAWGLLLRATVRAARTRDVPVFGSFASFASFAPILWVALSVTPLLAASWIVGARYFYLPAVGVAWLAAEALTRARTPILVGAVAALAGLSAGQSWSRRADVLSYEARLSAARRAIADGLAHGYDTFHVASGIKDIDLAVKADNRFAAYESHLLILGDVPASFVVVPTSRGADLDFLLARPPVPPSGAYHFGDRLVVGLARRGDDPPLDEVIARLPSIRFIRLRLGPGGRIIPRDLTDTLKAQSIEGTN